MQQKRYKIHIEGISPVVWNVMKKELADELKELKKDQLSEWEEKNWKRKVELNEKGEIIIPVRWFKSTLVNACKRTRIVPHFSTSKNQTYTNYVQSVMIYGDGSVCKDKDLKYYGAYVGAQGKNSSSKIWRVRPLLEKWKTSFELIDPAGRMKKEELKQLIEYAGMFEGIGDNRINNFGRFELKKLEEVKQK